MENKEINDSQFVIDFFEYSFLLEACMPPVAIARTMMWKRSIDEDFFKMSKDQTFNLYNWLKQSIKDRLKQPDNWVSKYDKELLEIWLARFDPKNQYEVLTKDGKIIKSFKYNDLYYIKVNTRINEDFIDNITLVG